MLQYACNEHCEDYFYFEEIMTMFEHKSEVLDVVIKYGVKDNANDSDVSRIDELINQRVAEGWEFVTYSFTSNTVGPRNSVLITFRKQK